MDKVYNPPVFYLKLLAVALIIFGARLWVIHNFGNTVPYWDQWDSEAAFLFILAERQLYGYPHFSWGQEIGID
ncbi:MAG: hypothetical protein ACTSXO_08380 [Candidatus Heimdallarchaeota archaeon]